MDSRGSIDIHPTATVDPLAELGEGVRIGPYAYIGPGVELGAETCIGPYTAILGPTRIGRANVIHSHVCLGDAPQDLSYRDQPTRLEIGDRNIIREFVTMHRGTQKGGGITRVGNDGLFMAYSHVAHDCQIGDGVIVANGATLGGHVLVEDRANISGLSAIHQFVRIGRHVMIGGGSIVVLDVPPFTMAAGNHARLFGLNRRGLVRAGFTPQAIEALKQAYHVLYRSGQRLAVACAQLRADGPQTAEVAHLLAFIEKSQRGMMR